MQLPEKGLVLIYGLPGVGKSSFIALLEKPQGYRRKRISHDIGYQELRNQSEELEREARTEGRCIIVEMDVDLKGQHSGYVIRHLSEFTVYISKPGRYEVVKARLPVLEKGSFSFEKGIQPDDSN